MMQKGRLARVAIGLAALTMLCSCVAIPTIDQAKERQLVAQQVAAPVDNVTVLSRCQFGIVPGDRREMVDGVCAVSEGRLILRTVDQASGKTEAYRVIERREGLSVAFCDSLVLKQTQVLAHDYSVGLVARPDGRVGFNDAGTRALYDALAAAGWPTAVAKRRVNPNEGMPGFNTVGPTLACSLL
jgi:hypothetical protein